ncbi:hypothetical protein POM88_054513 [Heracleum sosnowskyi]|uniref:Uncharacterized protein n=1 Tax=Heracleum sosnowskyi TaxID=360622 RepID=A0AAD8GNJ0_9APIA|nr:hypothetical protein POM88_054513 [Heracleum sosnowskyi]
MLCTVVHILTVFCFSQAKWYIKASEGGYVRAMYNTSLCYQYGDGVAQSYQRSKRWMKRAADRGHSKGSGVEYSTKGLGLFCGMLCIELYYACLISLYVYYESVEIFLQLLQM